MLKAAMLKTLLFIISTGLFSQLLATPLPVLSGVGGSFTAVDMNNETVQLKDYKNKIVLLAFGYTNCADICPFTLGYLDQLYKQLDTELQKKVQILFVTVDPNYDTPDHLKEFLAHFNKSFVGLTGSRKQIDTIINQFKAKYQAISDESSTLAAKHIRRVLVDEDPKKSNEIVTLYNHSVTMYLIDQQGETRNVSFTGTPKSQLVEYIKQLDAEGGAKQHPVEVSKAWIKKPPSNARSLAAYGLIKNTSKNAITITSMESSIAEVTELHQSKMEDGMMMMKAVGNFTLQPNEVLELKPLSYHIMLRKLIKEVNSDSLNIRLNFKNTPSLNVSFPVITMPQGY